MEESGILPKDPFAFVKHPKMSAVRFKVLRGCDYDSFLTCDDINMISMQKSFKQTIMFTPWKTNMSPENQWLEDVFPIEIVPFWGDVLVFGGVKYHCSLHSPLIN